MMIVIEGLLDDGELARFRAELLAAEWEDGTRTAGAFARHQKHNRQLRDGGELATRLGQAILDKLWANPLFISAALPRAVHPPRFNRYGVGETYGAHVDAALMRPAGRPTMRTDLSATLFLSEPGDYDGGELEADTGLGVQAVKLAAGDMILYPASTLHRVTPVTRGERLASFFAIESLVADLAARTQLFELDQAIQALAPELGQDHGELIRLTGVYHNLLRLWAVT